VIHYAGEVIYDIAGFVEKNKDSVSKPISDCLSGSSNKIVKQMFAAKQE
jgi:myosin-7